MHPALFREDTANSHTMPDAPHRFHIGIDCRTALSPKTGDRTYCLNLLKGLRDLALDPLRWRFYLLLDAPDAQHILPQAEYFAPVVLRARNSRLWTLVALPQYARRARLDLVHVQYLAPLFLPCPFITTIHDVVWKTFPETFPRLHHAVMNSGMPRTARRAERVLCGTRAAAEDIKKFLPVSQSKIRVTPYSIDPVFFEPIETDQIEVVRARYALGETPYVLSVGVLQPRKNLPRLIEAFAQLKKRNPQAPHRLVIVGKEGWGELPNFNEDSAPVFTGYVADEDLPALYAGADCFAYPSLYEGFGLPIIEAMACGAPVVTSNYGAMREVAGETAQLVDPLSVDSICAGIEAVLFNAHRAQELREKGRQHATEYSVARQASTTLEVYRGLLKR